MKGSQELTNIIVIMLDSLRPDHIHQYENEWVKTPNIDSLANDGVLFENAYPEGLPTIPVRTALFTGQYTLPFRPWKPLSPEDLTLPEILATYGYTTALITDTYHLFKPNMNFHKAFNEWIWIRGQEGDAYRSCPPKYNPEDFMKPEMKGTHVEKLLIQYLRNISDREKEEDYFVAKVIRESIRWLESNVKNQPFFLWIDCFDPHEPWDPPPEFEKLYTDPNYKGKKIIHPKYGTTEWLTEEELKYIRGLYAGEVTFVDKWVGKLLEKLKELELYDSSLIVLLSDHGVPIGEHGWILKHPHTLWSELVRMTLIIKFPENKYAGKRIKSLVENCDIPATILDTIGLKRETRYMHGKSLLPLIKGEVEKLKDYIITGYHASMHRCVRTEEWSFIFRPEGKDELYNLVKDPKEKNNVIDEFKDVAKKLASKLARCTYIRAAKRAETLRRMLQIKYEMSELPL